jgi:hypothetical protein
VGSSAPGESNTCPYGIPDRAGPDDTARNDPAVPAILGGATVMDDVFGAEDEESA